MKPAPHRVKLAPHAPIAVSDRFFNIHALAPRVTLTQEVKLALVCLLISDIFFLECNYSCGTCSLNASKCNSCPINSYRTLI